MEAKTIVAAGTLGLMVANHSSGNCLEGGLYLERSGGAPGLREAAKGREHIMSVRTREEDASPPRL